MKLTNLNFDSVLAYLSSINHVNQGGCGIAALAMYRWLELNKLLAADTAFVYLYRDYDKGLYENNRQYIENGEGEINSCNHAVLFHRGDYIDCSGILCGEFLSEYPFKQVVDEEILIESLNTDNWNCMFDRHNAIPFIEKKFKISLSDVSLM